MANTARILQRPTNTAEFLAWEQEQEARHEFRNGQIRMMAGGTQRHNRIAGNIFATLKSKLRGGACQPYLADTIVETDVKASYYPDVVIDCGPFKGDALLATTPTVIFEVLSSSTRNFDLSEKVPDYRDTASIKQIVLVEPDERLLRVWARTNAAWRELLIDERHEVLDIPSLGIDLSLEEIYEGAFD